MVTTIAAVARITGLRFTWSLLKALIIAKIAKIAKIANIANIENTRGNLKRL